MRRMLERIPLLPLLLRPLVPLPPLTGIIGLTSSNESGREVPGGLKPDQGCHANPSGTTKWSVAGPGVITEHCVGLFPVYWLNVHAWWTLLGSQGRPPAGTRLLS